MDAASLLTKISKGLLLVESLEDSLEDPLYLLRLFKQPECLKVDLEGGIEDNDGEVKYLGVGFDAGILSILKCRTQMVKLTSKKSMS